MKGIATVNIFLYKNNNLSREGNCFTMLLKIKNSFSYSPQRKVCLKHIEWGYPNRYGPQTDTFYYFDIKKKFILFQWMGLPSLLRGGSALYIKPTMPPGVSSVVIADTKR